MILLNDTIIAQADTHSISQPIHVCGNQSISEPHCLAHNGCAPGPSESLSNWRSLPVRLLDRRCTLRRVLRIGRLRIETTVALVPALGRRCDATSSERTQRVSDD